MSVLRKLDEKDITATIDELKKQSDISQFTDEKIREVVESSIREAMKHKSPFDIKFATYVAKTILRLR